MDSTERSRLFRCMGFDRRFLSQAQPPPLPTCDAVSKANPRVAAVT